MTSDSTSFTVTTLVAAASGILEDAGFRSIDASKMGLWKATETRAFEDANSIVCVAVYQTWTDLSSLWIDDQANLVDLISEYFSRSDPKVWDGYLVLLTPGIAPTGARESIIEIRRNTLHVRKLLASGDDLQTIDAVRRTLLPLLPLEQHQALQPRNVLDALSPLLARHGVDKDASRVAIAAFLEQRSIMEEVHTLTVKNQEQ